LREKKTVPEWKKGLLVKIPKQGDITHCNWRGLNLLSVPTKVMNLNVLSSIKSVIENNYEKNKLASEATVPAHTKLIHSVSLWSRAWNITATCI
jgi:hypothetical protein